MSSGSGRDKVGDHLSVVAPGGAPARLHGFDDGDVDARLTQMQRGGQAGKTGADDDDVGLAGSNKLRQNRTERRRRRPQRIGPAHFCDIHHRPLLIDRRSSDGRLAGAGSIWLV
jgi:hypothetical protein